MSNLPNYSFFSLISWASVQGSIARVDGESVDLLPDEVIQVMTDLAAGGPALPSRPKHHDRVLGEWYSRKMAQRRAHLRVAS